jgi:hypothetical protein
MYSIAEDCFFRPGTKGSSHNPTGKKPVGLSPVTKEASKVAPLAEPSGRHCVTMVFPHYVDAVRQCIVLSEGSSKW